jgi:proteasome lid subunit RPN8/RPN11
LTRCRIRKQESRIKNCSIRPGALETIVAHARDAAPAECCGILVGRQDEIVEAVRCRNLADNPNRFLIDPKDHFDAGRRARASGLDILGFYHSHPRSTPDPSPTDVAEASYPDHLYLIVSLAANPPAVKLYWFDGGGFKEVST